MNILIWFSLSSFEIASVQIETQNKYITNEIFLFLYFSLSLYKLLQKIVFPDKISLTLIFSSGKQNRAPSITQNPVNAGSVCPLPEDRNCDIDCISTFSEWSVCDKTNGKQGRTVTITQHPKNGGTICPVDEQRDCDVDCEFTWNEWQPATCVSGNLWQYRSVTNQCDATNAPQCDASQWTNLITVTPKNNGQACPPNEQTPCGKKNCEFTWNAWSTCDPITGKQGRNIAKTSDPVGYDPISSAPPSAQCPPPETRDCRVDCVFSWQQWTSCDQSTGK